MISYGPALRNRMGPGMGMGYQSAPDPFVPQRPGGFNPPPVWGPTGGGNPRPQINPDSGGGGWLDALKRSLSSPEGLYLGASALGGIGDWWERREDRKLRERMYDEGRQDEIDHRKAMGRALSARWGG